MQTLSPAKLLAVWETGRGQHELDRALTVLVAASPGASREELAALTIGERDARLLRLRTEMFGPHAEGYAECPACTARVELPINTAELAAPASASAEPHEVESHGARIRFRLPTSHDLADVVASADEREALHQLLRNCVVEVGSQTATHPGDWEPEILEPLSQAMLAAEPQAETILKLECPECGHRWPLLFDVADFFWHELAAQARQLLREIDVIARAYGWSEHEILSLPARRRQSYVEMITG